MIICCKYIFSYNYWSVSIVLSEHNTADDHEDFDTPSVKVSKVILLIM